MDPLRPAPLLTIVVPSYNAEDYLRRALEPLLGVRSGIEVIVVDDGSSDGTAALAREYAAARPEIFSVVQQSNRGHGGAIEAGIARARGIYLKVLDSDDWVSIPALEQVLRTLEDLEPDGGVDALFTDYVLDRVGKGNRLARFDTVFPAGQVFGWEKTNRFGARQILMMHAIIYRTDVVRCSSLSLPHNTFYVDNLFVVVPLARVRSMYYLPVGLYHYFIGRDGQSVNADVMLGRVDQQVFVNRLALQALPTPVAVAAGEVPVQLYSALLHYVSAICVVTSATLARGGTKAHLATRASFWRDVETETPWLHSHLRRSIAGASSNLRGEAGRRVTSLAYHVARRVVGFS